MLIRYYSTLIRSAWECSSVMWCWVVLHYICAVWISREHLTEVASVGTAQVSWPPASITSSSQAFCVKDIYIYMSSETLLCAKIRTAK